MGKALNSFVNATEETSENVQGTRLTFLDFTVPKNGAREKFIPHEMKKNPHERIVTEIREVKYLRDGYVKEDNITKKIVLESHGTEIVKEVLVPRGSDISKKTMVKVVDQVTRDLRRTTQE